MKKIISLIGITIIVGIGTTIVSACAKSDSEINVWNLSTWTNTQKKEINKKFMSIPFNVPAHYNTWAEYSYGAIYSDLDTSFAIINPNINFSQNKNVTWFIKPTPSSNEKPTDVFKKGLELSLKATDANKAITGKLTMMLKGDKKTILREYDFYSELNNIHFH